MEWQVSASFWPHPLPNILNARTLVQELMMGGGGAWELGARSSPACIAELVYNHGPVLPLTGPQFLSSV